jgi:hypothetical protein
MAAVQSQGGGGTGLVGFDDINVDISSTSSIGDFTFTNGSPVWKDGNPYLWAAALVAITVFSIVVFILHKR